MFIVIIKDRVAGLYVRNTRAVGHFPHLPQAKQYAKTLQEALDQRYNNTGMLETPNGLEH